MIRRFLIFLAVVLVWWWARRWLRPRRPSVGSRDRHQAPGVREAVMVRDPVCGTFFPRDGAMSLIRDGEPLYFCSERCRRTFLERGDLGRSARKPLEP